MIRTDAKDAPADIAWTASSVTAASAGSDERVRKAVDYGRKPYVPEKTLDELSLIMLKSMTAELHREAARHGTLQNRITMHL